MFLIAAALLVQLASFCCFAAQDRVPPGCPAAGRVVPGSSTAPTCPGQPGTPQSGQEVPPSARQAAPRAAGSSGPSEPDSADFSRDVPRAAGNLETLRLPPITVNPARSAFEFPLSLKPDSAYPAGYTPAGNGFIEPVRPKPGIRWGNVGLQSLMFLGIEHGYRMLDPTQPYTRAALKGPFFKDWFDTVKDLKGWTDSDEFIINYVGHPVQGAVSGRILLQNDPSNPYVVPGYNRAYGSSCLKAFGFAMLYSLQFELGPISEASLGNSRGTPFYPHPTSYVDLVITPTVGTGWMVGEDLADRYLIVPLERKISNRPLVFLIRTVSNPSRTMANALRFKWPWYRDTRF
jgi:hypothetical protein